MKKIEVIKFNARLYFMVDFLYGFFIFVKWARGHHICHIFLAVLFHNRLAVTFEDDSSFESTSTFQNSDGRC